jgi:uncharacterized protein YndB with AHSA1/START domain
MQLEARAQLEIAVSPEAVFDCATDYRNFARFIHAYGPIPGVRSAEMHGGTAPAAGVHRDVHMSDGTTVEEEILAFDRPSHHRYRWVRPPAPPFSLLVRAGEADWQFEPVQGGRATRLTFTYSFQLTSVLAYPLGLVLVRVFERWMMKALDGLRAQVEAGG